MTPDAYIEERIPAKYIEEGKKKIQKLWPYNKDLTKKYQFQINVEQTQGGGEVACMTY